MEEIDKAKDETKSPMENLTQVLTVGGSLGTGYVGILAAFMMLTSPISPKIYLYVPLCLVASGLAFGLLAIAIFRKK